jgi:LytS/YehU family sensor histidine kinase
MEIVLICIISVIVIGLVMALVRIQSKFDEERKRNRKLSLKNKDLLSNNLSLEANQLKFLLQPHTLNNVLSNLKVFSNKLNKGMDSLSEILEYIFYKGENHFVSVQDEIDFVKKYMALNDLFIHEIEAIKIIDSKIDTNSEYYNLECIPHLITAYFLENAFKHGDLNHPEFLRIYISLKDNRFEINVINRVKLDYTEKKSGIGLKNMKKRLNLLMQGKFEIKNSCNEEIYQSTLIIHF